MQQRILNRHCAILLLTVCIYLSCKKVPAAGEHYSLQYIDQQIKDFYNYDVGSYWVYKDLLTGDIDSFVVRSFGNNKDGLSATKDHNIEGTLIVVYDYNITSTPVYRGKYSWDLSGHEATLHYYHYLNNNVEEIVSYQFGSIPFKPFDMTTSPNNPYCNADTIHEGIQHVPQYLLGTAAYNDVYEIYVKQTSIECKNVIPQNDSLYIDKKAGLIKMVLNNYAHYNLELQRYHIVRKN